MFVGTALRVEKHDRTLPRLQFHARIQFYLRHASASATSAQAQSASAAATALTWLYHCNEAEAAQ